jgi:hypothetical protein
MTTSRVTGLDRVRPRTPAAEAAHPHEVNEIRDVDGKRALFSTTVPSAPSGFGAVTVECSSCGATSALSARQAVRFAVPSVHLPFIRRDHPSWLRCPACNRFTWSRVSLHF